jgi:hypothetical protein
VSQVRAPRPPLHKTQVELWLWVMVLGMVFSPATLVGWFVGVLVLRFTRARWWWVLIGAVVWVLYVGDIHGWNARTLMEEHFRLYREFFPDFMKASQAPNRPVFTPRLQSELFHGWLGFAGLGIPLGLCLSTISMAARPAVPPEWSAKAQATRAAERTKTLTKARTLAANPPEGKSTIPALAVMMDGDLPWAVSGRKLGNGGMPSFHLEPGTLNYPRVMVGEPGFGKTTMFLRLVEIYACLGYQVVFVDGKGSDPSLPQAVIASFKMGRGGSNVGVYPQEPATIWRGSPRNVVQKVLAVWQFDPRAEFFETVAAESLAAAIEIPGAPPVTSSKMLIDRLDINVLTRLHAKHGTPASRVALDDLRKSSKEWGFAGFAIRMRSLLRAVGTTLDGEWGFDDVDLAILTVPSGEKRKDASAIMRVLLEDFSQYASRRKQPGKPCLLIFDEFSALQGGRQTAMDLMERLRSTNTAVMLGVQSFEGLGVIHEARRLLNAASGGVVCFRTPSPEELVKLAGSQRVPEMTHNVDHFGLTDRGLVRPGKQFKVDPDAVREYVPGEATYIWGGKAAHIFVCRPELASWALLEADEIIRQAELAGERFQARLQREQEQEGNHAASTSGKRKVAS